MLSLNVDYFHAFQDLRARSVELFVKVSGVANEGVLLQLHTNQGNTRYVPLTNKTTVPRQK